MNRHGGAYHRLPGWSISNIENIAGILGEHVGQTGTNFLMNDALTGAEQGNVVRYFPLQLYQGRIRPEQMQPELQPCY
jgi:hypothetical protein